ncbi:Hypothetical predicted protein [Pelobates cultripes]|uniref:ALMS motif domain-containing protein n=1 Tax=Pelobates cultripes TaxID=61616 RepID=A0AAD1R7K2_PELCU|nr:Hypothetical predicted protein [Pelobates cultripes]
MYADKMKRKVARVAPLRLSPNEEMLLLKQERERRRKLRLQQVREQERFIAQQIRQDVKERRELQLQQLAEELRAEWQTEQDEKLRELEKVYQSSLRAIGEGHRQAKENEPDVEALEKQAAANRKKAEMRHREALKELKQHKENDLKDRMWHIKARMKALHIEKERAAKIASLPPPPPDPLENLEVLKKLPSVKISNIDNFSVSHYHLPEPYVDREMDREQPDARALAVEESKRLDALQKEVEIERRDQLEKAQLRGSHAIKMVHLTQDRDKFLKELEHMQQDDLARRRQIVSQMPQQLFEPAYRRAEVLEDWQRDLESAFEDMYTRGQKMKGDLVLHLKPQPLPVPSIKSLDEDLDLSVEPELVSESEPQSGSSEEVISLVRPPDGSREPQSRLVLKKLLNKIKTQKDQWCAKSDAETVSDTLESGSLPIMKEEFGIQPGTDQERNMAAVSVPQDDMTDHTVLAGDAVLLHPQEQAMQIRMAADRQKKMEEIERQKKEQLDLLERLEEQRKSIEAELTKAKLEVQEARRLEEGGQANACVQDTREPTAAEPEHLDVVPPAVEASCSTESPHIQIIRDYQQRLLQQNRQHKQSVDEARKRLHEYQLLLKKRYSHLSIREFPTESQNDTKAPPGLICKTKESSHMVVLDTSHEQIGTFNASLLPSMPISRQSSLQSVKPSTTVCRTSELVQSESASLSTSQGQHVNVRSLSTCPVTEQHGPRPHAFTHEKTPVNVQNTTSKVLTGISELLYNKESNEETIGVDKEYQSPEESRVKPQDAVTQSESQSSLSSLWDTSSDSYYPLPSVISLGLPQVESTVSDTTKPQVAPQPLPWSFGDFSSVQEFRERLISSTSQIQSQQDHLKELQGQLDKQRDSLLFKQKIQEEHLLQKQKALEEQMRKHQESLEQYLGGTTDGQRTLPDDLGQMPQKDCFSLMSSLLNALEGDEDVQFENAGGLFKGPGREQRRRSSKPPVTKTKLGPMLTQHELSAILEVETPTSGRCSSVGAPELKKSWSGLKDRPGGEALLIPKDHYLENSSNSSLLDLDLSRISTSSKDRSSNDSLTSQRSLPKLSWREILSLEANSSQLLKDTDQSQNSELQTGMPSYPSRAGIDFHVPLPVPDPSHWFIPTDLSLMQGSTEQSKPDTSFSPYVLTLEPFSDHLSTTTISTGSFLTSENSVRSPLNPECISDLQRCNYSIIRQMPDMSPIPAGTCCPVPSRLSDSKSTESSPNSDEHRSHIQQIIEKYTKDLSLSLERNLSFHAPTAAADVSAEDGNQYSMTFHPLDPKPDFNISTPSYALSGNSRSSQCSNQFSQISPSIQESSCQQSPISSNQHNNQSTISSPGLRSSQSVESVAKSPTEINQTLDSSASFHPLYPERTLNETNPTMENEESSVCVLSNLSTRTLNREGLSTSSETPQEQIPRYGNVTPPSVEILRGGNENLIEDHGSFHTLLATQTTITDSVLSEHPITDLSVKKNGSPYQFKEFYTNKDLKVDRFTERNYIPDQEKCERSLHLKQNFPPRIALVAECDSSSQTKCERFSDGIHTESSINNSSVNPLTLFPSSCSTFSLASHISEWGKGSACGIMEEPDLTLVSLNDSSVVGSESFTSATIASKHCEEQSSVESGFHPLTAEVDASGVTLPDWSSAGLCVTEESLSQHFTEMNLEISSSSGNLQEAFLRKKKDFVERSAKRLENLKQKDGTSNKTNFKPSLNPASNKPLELSNNSAPAALSDVGQLKKVVEVRVCSPEDRKLTELEMQQRTIRLYNQLDEVKARKEEMMRQKSYAKNREKAKEFKKKTLEKLRSKKIQ